MQNKFAYLLARIFFFCFSIFLLSTFFMPLISVDKYEEYEFNDGYYNEKYVGTQKPLATKITPYQLTMALFTKPATIMECKANYEKVEKHLSNLLAQGEITSEEYDALLADDETTNLYLSKKFHYGDTDYDRLFTKSSALGVVCIATYAILAFFVLLNLINLFKNSKLLYTANYQFGFVSAIVFLVLAIFTFAFYMETTKILFAGKLVQLTTICGSPKALLYILLFSSIAYAFIGKIVNYYFQIDAIRRKEVPDIILAKKPPKYKHHQHYGNRKRFRL